MSVAIKGMYLNERDIALFRYLHAVKVATYDQIGRDIYTGICLDAVGNRIRKLERNKLVTVGTDRLHFQGKRYVSLCKSCFDEFVRKGHELRLELRSEKVQHDLTLVDIRSLFLKSLKTQNYQTENEIQTWSLRFKHLNSDAMITTQWGHTSLDIPIEYESSQKKAERYEPFLKKYYNAQDHPLVVFVADSQSTISIVMKMEKKLYNWDKPKFFYCLKQSLFNDATLRFSNYNEATLSLG